LYPSVNLRLVGQERTVPLAAQFKTWLDNALHSVLRKDSLGGTTR